MLSILTAIPFDGNQMSVKIWPESGFCRKNAIGKRQEHRCNDVAIQEAAWRGNTCMTVVSLANSVFSGNANGTVRRVFSLNELHFPIPLWEPEAKGLGLKVQIVTLRRSEKNRAQALFHLRFIRACTKRSPRGWTRRCQGIRIVPDLSYLSFTLFPDRMADEVSRRTP